MRPARAAKTMRARSWLGELACALQYSTPSQSVSLGLCVGLTLYLYLVGGR